MNDVSQRIKPATIHKTIEVKASIERAFEVFTGHIGDWWSRDFSINGGIPQKGVIVEPHSGGRWYEVGEDGSECQWGRVLEWDEPRRVVLAWQINAEWRYDPDFETIVDVRFEDRDGSTLVTLEHRELERFGEAATRQAEQMGGGWGMLLERFRNAVGQE
jgi:uncharacterized protein YndB with AHSA1/START domain